MLLNPDRLISKDELLQAVWPGVVVTENSLVQCVTELRRELGANGVRSKRSLAAAIGCTRCSVMLG